MSEYYLATDKRKGKCSKCGRKVRDEMLVLNVREIEPPGYSAYPEYRYICTTHLTVDEMADAIMKSGGSK